MALNFVPQPGQFLGQTRQPILDNFTAISQQFEIDHVGFNLPNQGKHARVTFPVQPTPLAFIPPIAAGDFTLYNQLSTLTGLNELNIVNAAGTATQMSASLKAANGWTYLPSGLLLKWGTASAAGNSTTIVPFPGGAGIPAFTAIYSMQVTTNNGSNPVPNQLVSLGNYGIANFVVYNRQLIGSSSAVNFTYFAIGA